MSLPRLTNGAPLVYNKKKKKTQVSPSGLTLNFSASFPSTDHYSRLINKDKLIQEKRMPRYKHQTCHGAAIFRRQIMLSFEGELDKNSAVRKEAGQAKSTWALNTKQWLSHRCIASVWQWWGNCWQFASPVKHLLSKNNGSEEETEEKKIISLILVLYYFRLFPETAPKASQFYRRLLSISGYAQQQSAW